MTTQFIELETINDQELQVATGGGFPWVFNSFATECIAKPIAGATYYSLTGDVLNNGGPGMTAGSMIAQKLDKG